MLAEHSEDESDGGDEGGDESDLSAEQSYEMTDGFGNEAQEPEPEEPTLDEAEAIDHGEILQDLGVTLSDLADDEADRSSVELEDMVAEFLINENE